MFSPLNYSYFLFQKKILCLLVFDLLICDIKTFILFLSLLIYLSHSRTPAVGVVFNVPIMPRFIMILVTHVSGAGPQLKIKSPVISWPQNIWLGTPLGRLFLLSSGEFHLFVMLDHITIMSFWYNSIFDI